MVVRVMEDEHSAHNAYQIYNIYIFSYFKNGNINY